MPGSVIYLALPVMDEAETLTSVLEALSVQSVQDYRLFICVNQPDEWWDQKEKKAICETNHETLEMINSLKDPRITCIDRSSKGKGWIGRNHGIGWARKVLMDRISAVASSEDYLVSLDADTVFGPGYLKSVKNNLDENPKAVALSIPYYHRLTGNEPIDRSMLRYEIYMRSYAINLFRINNPYCFSALGSAIALPIRSYKAIGGMTPKLSGEDFYFLQKLVKFGTVLHWNSELVYPAARLSQRVYFGTGPALIKGLEGDWNSYPVYNMSLFDEIRETQTKFYDLYYKDLPTPMDEFFETRLKGAPWDLLRKNARTPEQFIRSCHEKIDGLRILQYLKERNQNEPQSDERSLLGILRAKQQESMAGFMADDFSILSFSESSLDYLNKIRKVLFEIEMQSRKRHWDESRNKWVGECDEGRAAL
jgi:hypothetical protein